MTDIKNILFNNIEWEKYHTHEEEDEDLFDGEDSFSMIKMAQTPLGNLHLDSANPIQNMNFWLCHVNFRITMEDLKKISELKGVETIAPMTSYQFLLGVGKLFKETSVKLNIEDFFLFPITSEIKLQIVNLRSKLSEYDFWAIYVLPDGNLTHFIAKNDSTYQVKLEQFIKSCEISSGFLYTCEDENFNE